MYRKQIERLDSFLLHDGSAVQELSAVADVADFQLNQVTGSKLAINGKVKHHQLTDSMSELQAHADCPYAAHF